MLSLITLSLLTATASTGRTLELGALAHAQSVAAPATEPIAGAVALVDGFARVSANVHHARDLKLDTLAQAQSAAGVVVEPIAGAVAAVDGFAHVGANVHDARDVKVDTLAEAQSVATAAVEPIAGAVALVDGFARVSANVHHARDLKLDTLAQAQSAAVAIVEPIAGAVAVVDGFAHVGANVHHMRDVNMDALAQAQSVTGAVVEPIAGAVALVNGFAHVGANVHHKRDVKVTAASEVAAAVEAVVNPVTGATAQVQGTAHVMAEVHHGERSVCPSGTVLACLSPFDCGCKKVGVDVDVCAFVQASVAAQLLGTQVGVDAEVCLCAEATATITVPELGICPLISHVRKTLPTCQHGHQLCSATGPACSCDYPYALATDGLSCVLPPSPKARSKRSRSAGLKKTCPGVNEEACPFTLSRFSTYECIDTTSSVESCGGCVGFGGVNCLDTPGAAGVGCERGRCQILSCKRGWYRAFDGTCHRSLAL